MCTLLEFKTVLTAGLFFGADGDEPADEQCKLQQHAHRDAGSRIPVSLQEPITSQPAAACDAGPPGASLVRL